MSQDHRHAVDEFSRTQARAVLIGIAVLLVLGLAGLGLVWLLVHRY